MAFWIARRPGRAALFLPLGGTRANPNVIIPLYKTDNSELSELVHAVLEKQGRGADFNKIMERAERDSEMRIKTHEASQELHKRLREQARYPKLKWGGLKPVRKR